VVLAHLAEVMSLAFEQVVPDVLDSHFVLSECTGLVGTDAASRPQRLDGLKVLHQHHLQRETFGRDGQTNRDTSQQSFRHATILKRDSTWPPGFRCRR
jgi:hypothetical protein